VRSRDATDLFADARDAPSKLARLIKRSKNSRFEDDLAWQITARGLPVPLRQHRFVEARKFTADFAWPSIEFRLLVEVQGGIFRLGGGAHSHPTNLLRDIEKAQLAALGGWFVLPVTTDEVSKGTAIGHLERFFASRGWKR
jgi:very-short-patch-repair endonuclease